MSKPKKIMMLASLGLASLAFAAAGAAKLAGVEAVHTSFATMGLPVWFGYFVGLCELAGAIGIWLRRTRSFASAGLFIIMLGAIYFHVVYEAIPNAIPAIILAVLTAFIFKTPTAESNGNA
ncbi:DoxX family protein [Aestuariibacter sp. GS-14]|uniref:DoxX family protein n=1 Tax=Aestuariibacter sp. GS-14 TaxID=2590670 RepID=UPI0011279927|nr:DoxX family protein [Aestuariibacter sp. GS-14]TPV54307.1 DoxX family protein [Aestuariibacter sp. GS-14]